MKARKKAVVIDFISIDELSIDTWTKIKDWVISFNDSVAKNFDFSLADANFNFKVKTLEGTSYAVTTDDVIIRGVNGEYYPCKKEIFEKTYDILENE